MILFYFTIGLHCVQHTKDLQGGRYKTLHELRVKNICSTVTGRQKHAWVTVPGL